MKLHFIRFLIIMQKFSIYDNLKLKYWTVRGFKVEILCIELSRATQGGKELYETIVYKYSWITNKWIRLVVLLVGCGDLYEAAHRNL